MERPEEQSQMENNELLHPELPENNNVQEENEATDELHNPDEYAGLSKEELIEKLKDILKNEDVLPFRNNVNTIKDTFRNITKDQIEEQKKNFEETKEEGDEFEYHNPLDEKFEDLLKDFNQKRAEQKKKRERYLNDNLKQKKEILEALKTLPENTGNIAVGFEKLQSLQTLWRSIGPVPAGMADGLWKNYQFYVTKFFEGVKISKELKELDYKKNLELKTELCEKAEALENESSVRNALDQLKDLQEKWREIGQVSQEDKDKLWERFKAAADKVYDKKRNLLADQKIKQQENLAKKQVLCEQMEALGSSEHSTHKDWQATNEAVNALMEEWKKIGYTTKEDNGETWKRFKKARQQFYDNKDKFYNQRKDDENQNLERKIRLCEQAEKIQDTEDWQKGANELKRLQAEWKNIGPAPRKHSDKIWKRFRAACDAFFNRKATQHAEAEQKLQANVEVRNNISEQVENLSLDQDLKQLLDALKSYQNQWKEAGEIPYKEKDAVYGRFRKAVDKVMEKVREKGGNNNQLLQMKYEQMSQTDKGKDDLKRERYHLQDKIKKIQADVNLWENNLMFFAKSKNADAMKAEFNEKIEKAKAEIVKLKAQLKLIPN